MAGPPHGLLRAPRHRDHRATLGVLFYHRIFGDITSQGVRWPRNDCLWAHCNRSVPASL